jgi:phosphatidylinositol alpha-mannosyltransferase
LAARLRPPQKGRRWRPRDNRWLAAPALLTVSAIVAVVAIAKLGPAQVWQALTTVRAGWTALALVLMMVSFAARGESWFAVIRAAIPATRVHRASVTRALLIGMATSTVAPARLGEATRAWVLARRLGRPREQLALVFGTILTQTILNLIALFALALVAADAAARRHVPVSTLGAAALVPLALAGALVAAPRLLRRAATASRQRIQRPAAWTLARLAQARAGLAVLRKPWPAVHAATAQFAGWALQLAVCTAVLRALRIQVPIGAAAAVLLAVNITSVVPVTPSNVGVFQAACIAALAPFGVAAGRGLAYGLVLQAVEVTAALALGVPASLKEGLSWRDLRRAPPPPPPP